MHVSVAIPTSNLRRSLVDAIGSVVRQECKFSFEIIVLDNGSDVRSAKTTEEIAIVAPVPVRYFHVPTPGLHNGRHEGARQARGTILVYIDDDVVASPGWLQAIADAFQDDSTHLVGGRSLPDYEANPPTWLEAFWTHSPEGYHICSSLSLIDLGDELHVVDPNCIWGLNFAIRKQTLEQLGGFNPDGMPWTLRRYRGDGESAVTRKAKAFGLKAVYHPNALVYHRIPQSRLTIEYFERRAFLQGISDSFTRIRQGGRIERQPLPTPHAKLNRGLVVDLVLRWSRYACHPVRHGRSFLQRRLVREPSADVANLIDDETAEIKARVEQAYRVGYEFHRDAVAQDPELLAWVLREDYWDYRLPCYANSSRDMPGCAE